LPDKLPAAPKPSWRPCDVNSTADVSSAAH
jgi:hypothetical protein